MPDANLLLRTSTWCARLSAPATLQRARQERGEKPRADLFRSLGTGDKLEARRRLPAKLVAMRLQFNQKQADLRNGFEPGRVPDEYELQPEAFQLVQQELSEDERERASRPTQTQAESANEAYHFDLQQSTELTVGGSRSASRVDEQVLPRPCHLSRASPGGTGGIASD